MADLAQFGGLAQGTGRKGLMSPSSIPETGEPLDITIRVAGPDSARQRRIRRVEWRAARQKQEADDGLRGLRGRRAHGDRLPQLWVVWCCPKAAR